MRPKSKQQARPASAGRAFLLGVRAFFANPPSNASNQYLPFTYLYVRDDCCGGDRMRKVYILRENEEDGAVLDALGGADPEEVENPRCPECGGSTLLAYAEGEDYCVLTWCSLTEVDKTATPDAWYLVCQDFDCPYEEQVERADHPAGAELFNLDTADMEFDEEYGLVTGEPAYMLMLIKSLEEAKKANPHRKLDDHLDEARWRYEEGMKAVREWVQRIPQGRKIQFWACSEMRNALFITATDEMMLVRMLPEGEMVGVRLDTLRGYGPPKFRPEESVPEAEQEKGLGFVLVTGWSEYVVVKGYHLRLFDVDRFGQYRVWADEPEVIEALGLETGMNKGHGRFRSSDIQERYTVSRMVKVKGHWVRVQGEVQRSGHLAVMTENPDIASALGLKLVKYEWEEGSCREMVPRYTGSISPEEVEATEDVRTYSWPIPELGEK